MLQPSAIRADLLHCRKDLHAVLQPLLYRKIRGLVPSPQMTALAQTLARHPEHRHQIHSLNLTMNELDVNNYSGPAGLRLARSQARDTATIILHHAQPRALTVTLADDDSEHILTSVDSTGLEELTLRATVDGSRPPARAHAVSLRWLACMGRALNAVRVLRLEGLANREEPIERADEDEASRNERHEAIKAQALMSYPSSTPNLQLIAAHACGWTEQISLGLQLHKVSKLTRLELPGIPLDIYLDEGHRMPLLTHLSVAAPVRPDNLFAIVSLLATLAPNLEHLRLCAFNELGATDVPQAFASLAYPLGSATSSSPHFLAVSAIPGRHPGPNRYLVCQKA